MLSKINEKLMQVKARVLSGRKLKAMLREAQQFLHDEYNKCSLLRERLASEKSDVDKIEGLSLTALFYSILRTKEAHLEKEKQEYLAAKLKFDESVQAVKDAREEVQRLRAELAPFTHVEAEYVYLINEIQQASSACSTATSRVRSALDECRARLAKTERDIKRLSRTRLELIEEG
ncbi:MAG: hypothetical protein QNJ46_33985 [Leptolyngbyaceae cyanobacterium MO_188.B28]|nr:hypothetical protein [Leptolyngbyaceae cyanobacterium MO_188.B28]